MRSLNLFNVYFARAEPELRYDKTRRTENGSSEVQGKGRGCFSLQKSDCVGSATRAERKANDARAYFVLSVYAVQELWPVRKVPQSSAKHVAFRVKEPVVPHGREGPAWD